MPPASGRHPTASPTNGAEPGWSPAPRGGARGFAEQAGTLLVVTSDLSHFQSEGERNQSWIGGGMFAISLVYGLHSLGLGTSCLNWSKRHALDQRFRTEIGIPDEDAIIMLVAVGHLRESFRVAQSPPKRSGEALRHPGGTPHRTVDAERPDTHPVATSAGVAGVGAEFPEADRGRMTVNGTPPRP